MYHLKQRVLRSGEQEKVVKILSTEDSKVAFAIFRQLNDAVNAHSKGSYVIENRIYDGVKVVCSAKFIVSEAFKI